MHPFATSTSADFTLGFFAPLRGLIIVTKNPRLLRHCIVPFLIAFVAVALWMIACVLLAKAGITWLGGGVDNNVLRWVVYILGALIGVALVIVLALLFFFIFVQIIAAPFNAMLAQATESILNCKVPVLESDLWRETMGAIRISLLMLIRSIAVTIGLLPVNLIPVVGTIAYVALTMFFNSQALGLEFLDYSLERRYLSFKERLAWVKARRTPVLGLGAGVSLILFLPLINLLFLPFCVVGATELFVRLSEQDASDTA